MNRIKELALIDKEFILCPYNNGFKLLRPDEAKNNKNIILQPTFTVDQILKFQFNIYFLNTQSQVISLSEENVKQMGGTSLNDMIGKTVMRYVIHKKDGVKTISNDLKVLKNLSTGIFEEHLTFRGDILKNHLSIKSPWYDPNNKVVGVFGCSLLINGQNTIDFINMVSRLGMLSTFHNQQTIESTQQPFPTIFQKRIASLNNIQIYFTQRELDVIYFLIRGKTVKSIAAILNLSPRTVEQHLINIKLKLGVTSKSDVIELIVDHLIFE